MDARSHKHNYTQLSIEWIMLHTLQTLFHKWTTMTYVNKPIGWQHTPHIHVDVDSPYMYPHVHVHVDLYLSGQHLNIFGHNIEPGCHL